MMTMVLLVIAVMMTMMKSKQSFETRIKQTQTQENSKKLCKHMSKHKDGNILIPALTKDLNKFFLALVSLAKTRPIYKVRFVTSAICDIRQVVRFCN